MALALFSNKGLQYEDPKRGPIQAIYVPKAEDIRTYSDLQTGNIKEISARYGKTTQKPIFQIERGQVVVYGTVHPQLTDRVEDVSVYLPQQLVPPKCNVFYLIFGTEIVHGIQTIDDEGKHQWQVARLIPAGSGEKFDPKSPPTQDAINNIVIEQIISSAAERLIMREDNSFCIAVTGNDKLLKALQTKIEPYNLDVIRLETLKPSKKSKPLYRQYNYSLMLLGCAILSSVLVMASGAYWYSKEKVLNEQQKVSRRIQQDIQAIEKNDTIGYIQNPTDVLAKMQQSLAHLPSSLLNAVAQISAEFGALQDVTLVTAKSTDEFSQNVQDVFLDERVQEDITLQAKITNLKNTFLVDQERLAKSIVETRPWLKELKSFSESTGGNSMCLQVKIQLDNTTKQDEEAL